MADRAGLGVLGFIFGGVTAAVILVAVTVVIGHVDGRFALDTPPTQITTARTCKARASARSSIATSIFCPTPGGSRGRWTNGTSEH